MGGSLPDRPTIPSPRDGLGYTVGTLGELTQVDEIYTYFGALAAASDRVEFFQLGQGFEERDMLVVAIAEPEHLRNIETNKEYLNSLCDSRQTDRSTAVEKIKDALRVYWMIAGLHSPEFGPPEMLIQDP